MFVLFFWYIGRYSVLWYFSSLMVCRHCQRPPQKSWPSVKRTASKWSCNARRRKPWAPCILSLVFSCTAVGDMTCGCVCMHPCLVCQGSQEPGRSVDALSRPQFWWLHPQELPLWRQGRRENQNGCCRRRVGLIILVSVDGYGNGTCWWVSFCNEFVVVFSSFININLYPLLFLVSN